MQSAMLCELELGVILRRRCPEAAATPCESCGKRVCTMHQRPHTTPGRPPVPWCIDCIRKAAPLAEAERPDRYLHEPYYETSSMGLLGDSLALSSDTSAPAPFEGGGGGFGGGGASGGWDDATGFTAGDYAAFDRTVAADRNDARGSYDS